MADKVLIKEDIELEVKDTNDIISEIEFDTEDDMLICTDIIRSLEQYAAKNIKDDKTVQLPYIGSVRKDPVKKMFKEQKKELKAIRKQCDKDTYRQIVKDKVNSIIKQQESLEYRYIQCEQLKRLYKKEYEHNCKTKGEAYANMIIYSKTLFEYVPFDMEVQKMYEELMDKDNG